MNRFALAAVLTLTTAAPALADMVAPIEAACREKKAGAPCRAEFGEGVCTKATCGRNDYSEGPPPRQKLVDCLQCLAPPTDAGIAGRKKAKK